MNSSIRIINYSLKNNNNNKILDILGLNNKNINNNIIKIPIFYSSLSMDSFLNLFNAIISIANNKILSSFSLAGQIQTGLKKKINEIELQKLKDYINSSETIQNFISIINNKIYNNINDSNYYLENNSKKELNNMIFNCYFLQSIKNISFNRLQIITNKKNVNNVLLNNLSVPFRTEKDEIINKKKIKTENDLKIIFKIKKKYIKNKELLINNIKEYKNKYLSEILRLYNEYNFNFKNKISNFNIKVFIGDKNDELTIYKNFIRIMVLNLNNNKVKYLLSEILENKLEYESFFIYFIDNIYENSIKRNDGNIIEYDINLDLIENDDPSLNDHIYFYGHYFYHSFLNISKNINFEDYDLENLNLEINLQEKKLILIFKIMKMNIFLNIIYLIILIIIINYY